MVHPTAKVSEKVKRKWPIWTWFYSYNPLHWPYPPKVLTSWTVDIGSIRWIN